MGSSLSKRATPFPGVRAVNKGSTSEAVTLALKPCPSPDISNQEAGTFAKEICTLLRTCSGVRKIHGTSRRWHRCSKPGVGKEGEKKNKERKKLHKSSLGYSRNINAWAERMEQPSFEEKCEELDLQSCGQ